MVAAAKTLRPLIVEARDEIEEARRLPPALVTAMDEAGLFHVHVEQSGGCLPPW
jgi:alkylation response protein AidB-like acyl-CoA dehydrogenase